MMDREKFVVKMKEKGTADAVALQEKAHELIGTELNAEKVAIPDFKAAVANRNMLERPVGFVCKTSAGRVVKLLQKYDSEIYTGEPEELHAQWGFVWSDDPAHALPFIELATSPYNAGNCCTEDGVTYRSVIDNNTWAPSTYPEGWEAV